VSGLATNLSAFKVELGEAINRDRYFEAGRLSPPQKTRTEYTKIADEWLQSKAVKPVLERLIRAIKKGGAHTSNDPAEALLAALNADKGLMAALDKLSPDYLIEEIRGSTGEPQGRLRSFLGEVLLKLYK